jgi:hypothetical protein
MNNVIWMVSCLRIDSMISWVYGMLPEGEPRWTIPEYPELDLKMDGVV